MEIPVHENLAMTSPRTSIHSTGSNTSTNSLASIGSPSNLLHRRTTMASLSSLKGNPNRSGVPFDRRQRFQGPNKPLNQQCTHLTMTRLFTNEYRCSQCNNPPTNGWLWICTQDQELILEDLEDRGAVEKFDALDDIFGRPSKPGKRSAAARQDLNSITEEIGDRQLSEYTPAQLQIIKDQRAHVLDVARKQNLGEFRRASTFYQSKHHDRGLDLPRLQNPLLSDTQSEPRAQKPWFPFLGGECQTKWCHNCRPHGLERSWLSLDAVVNGELPLEAVHGLSFSLQGERTVSLVKHVANLGLRPNPTTLLRIHPTATRKPRHRLLGSPPKTGSPQAIQGLGIMGSQTEPSITSKVTETTPRTASGTIRSRRLASKYPAASYPEIIPELPLLLTPLSPTNGSFPPVIPFPPTPHLTRRHSFSNLPRLSVVIDIPLPLQTDEEIQSTSRLSSPTNDMEDYAQAVADLESSVTAATLTDMEAEELNRGEGIGAFGSEPLKVDGGVALVEESVEEHIPDVMTQF